MVSADLVDKSWEIKFLYSLYFMVKNNKFKYLYCKKYLTQFITMSTIGYGDISPVTNMEKIYGLIVTLVACGVFAFCVNMIGSIFQEKA